MKKCIFISILLVLTTNSFSQFRWTAKPEEIPLFKFFQENFDSTVVYLPSIWVGDGYTKQRMFLVSKKDSYLTHFIYYNPNADALQESLLPYPQAVRNFLVTSMIEYRKTLPDTNKYFFPVYVETKKQTEHWATVISNDCWNLQDDLSDEKCNERGNWLVERSSYVFYLITKNKIKTLIFTAPDWDEGYCKPETIETRKKILKVMQAFDKIFYNFLNGTAKYNSSIKPVN